MTTTQTKTFLGLPLNLMWGYVAIIFFMTGDGFEMAFLSHYITTLGFSASESSFVFTIYGLTAALSAWVSGVIAEVITPQRTMKIGVVLWIVFHILFLTLGLENSNYFNIILFYGLRGIAYPLFFYAFIVVIINNVSPNKVSAALGWYWTVYSIGIGVLGSYIPSFTIPFMGEMGTLYLSLAFVAIGGLIAITTLRNIVVSNKDSLSLKEKLLEIAKAVTLLSNKSIALLCIVRIINTIPVFGFAVIMPLMFVDELGVSMSDWLRIWSVFFFASIIANVAWGIIAEHMNWMFMIRVWGCLGVGVSCLLFYFIPQQFPGNFLMACIPAIALGFFLPAFVPIIPIMTKIAPDHKGAVVSVCNLAAGLSNFVAPTIATIFLPICGIVGIVYIYFALFVFASLLTFFVKYDSKSN